MDDAGQLPVAPLREDEWRPWWEPSDAERAHLPPLVDEQVLGYPLRTIIGRLRHRGPRGGSRSLQVGWANGCVTSYGDYLTDDGAGEARQRTEERLHTAIVAAEETGCVVGAVGRSSPTGLLPLRHEEGEVGLMTGLVFDLAFSGNATVYESNLLVVGGEYLQMGLRLHVVPLSRVDLLVPGAALLRQMLRRGMWPWDMWPWE